jgi:hypothetical protein
MIGALLLASVAAVPAMAQGQPQGDWHQNGGDHGDRGSDHGDRGGRGDGGNRGGGGPQGGAPVRAPGQAQAPRPDVQRPDAQRPDAQRPDRSQGGALAGLQAERRDGGDGGHRVSGRPDNGVQVWRNDRGNAQRPDWNSRPGNDRPGGWDGNRDGNRDGRPGNWNDDRRGDDRGGWNNDRRGGDRSGWNNGWRNDRRYDWQGWRNSHRDYYRVGPYRAPHGYYGGYRRWGIGGRIDPIFFGQDYWIGNPGYYRLPPAYGSYRWVRYYNDALLIDIYSGTVVDEIPGFFW